MLLQYCPLVAKRSTPQLLLRDKFVHLCPLNKYPLSVMTYEQDRYVPYLHGTYILVCK